jgi:hypothetical protein
LISSILVQLGIENKHSLVSLSTEHTHRVIQHLREMSPTTFDAIAIGIQCFSRRIRSSNMVVADLTRYLDAINASEHVGICLPCLYGISDALPRLQFLSRAGGNTQTITRHMGDQHPHCVNESDFHKELARINMKPPHAKSSQTKLQFSSATRRTVRTVSTDERALLGRMLALTGLPVKQIDSDVFRDVSRRSCVPQCELVCSWIRSLLRHLILHDRCL